MRAIILLPWLMMTLLFIPPAAPTADGEALLQIISKWQVSRPSNWTGDDPCQNWEGVECNANSRVSVLNLTNKGLSGGIPTEMGNLEGLVSLDVSNAKSNSGPWNHVTGDLSALSGLTNLQSLNLTFNELSEQFPTVVLQFTGLTALRLDNAKLTGAFPQGLSKLSNLQYLYLGNNSMTGSMPSELGSLINLIELSLWGNTFDSSIPTNLGDLTNLKYLTLHDCSLFGGLPSEFQNLKNLEKLYLYANSLTGPIPETWKNMENLQDLRLQHNQLTKSFPSWIQNSTSLISVDLSYNDLYESVPNITNNHLENLNIACNFFSGTTPSSVKTNLTDAQNCFEKHYQDDNRALCYNYYSCSSFNKTVLINGVCPQCPISQTLSNASSCICLGGTSSQGSGGQSNSHNLGKIIGAVVGAAVVILFTLFGFLAFKKCRHSQTEDPKNTSKPNYGDKFYAKESQGYWEAPKGVQRFSLEELAKASSGFNSENEIGVGGFGKVFYGLLENGKEVAIKRASSSSMQGSAEFRNEVMLLSRLHHRNLVRIEGFCDDDDLQILVYEYVPNGNLHTHLFQSTAGDSFGWLRRLDVAIGIAQGLDYLHSFADPPVIHRDVKPSNILLDNNLVAKVADFGISKTTLESETHISTTPAGTAGYIDPQYFLRRQLTTASDVYSFGVCLLELVTGQKAIDPSRVEDHNLVEWVKMTMKVDGLEGIIDPRMHGSCPLPIYQNIAQLAINCAAFNKNERPQMKEVVAVLDKCLRAACPPPLPADSLQPPEDHVLAIEVLEEEETDSRSGITFNSTLSASKSAFKGDSLMPR